jgi:integrase
MAAGPKAAPSRPRVQVSTSVINIRVGYPAQASRCLISRADTRHTCASLLAALDVHPRVAMRILRHSQISVTMNVYTQIPTPENAQGAGPA